MAARPGRHATPWWGYALAVAILILAFLPTVRWLVTTWLGDPYYSHGLVLPLIAIALIWRRERTSAAKESPADDSRGWVWGPPLLAICFLGHILSLRRSLYSLSTLCLLVGLAAIALTLGGRRIVRRHAFPLALMLLIIPIPLLEQWTPYLARGVARAAAASAQVLGLSIERDGARLILPQAELVIGAPCSGINSLLALLALGALYAYALQGAILNRVILFLSAIPIALLSNYLRVMLLVIVAGTAGSGRMLTWLHDGSGAVLFALAAGLLVWMGRVLRCGATHAI